MRTWAVVPPLLGLHTVTRNVRAVQGRTWDGDHADTRHLEVNETAYTAQAFESFESEFSDESTEDSEQIAISYLDQKSALIPGEHSKVLADVGYALVPDGDGWSGPWSTKQRASSDAHGAQFEKVQLLEHYAMVKCVGECQSVADLSSWPEDFRLAAAAGGLVTSAEVAVLPQVQDSADGLVSAEASEVFVSRTLLAPLHSDIYVVKVRDIIAWRTTSSGGATSSVHMSQNYAVVESELHKHSFLPPVVEDCHHDDQDQSLLGKLSSVVPVLATVTKLPPDWSATVVEQLKEKDEVLVDQDMLVGTPGDQESSTYLVNVRDIIARRTSSSSTSWDTFSPEYAHVTAPVAFDHYWHPLPEKDRSTSGFVSYVQYGVTASGATQTALVERPDMLVALKKNPDTYAVKVRDVIAKIDSSSHDNRIQLSSHILVTKEFTRDIADEEGNSRSFVLGRTIRPLQRVLVRLLPEEGSDDGLSVSAYVLVETKNIRAENMFQNPEGVDLEWADSFVVHVRDIIALLTLERLQTILTT